MRSEYGHPPPVLQQTRPGLGTYVTVGVSGLPRLEAEAALERAFATVARVEAILSFHAADSDLARLHASRVGCTVEVAADTFAVLQCADRLHRLSEGLFDVTVAPVLVQAGLLPAPTCSGWHPDPSARWGDVVLLPPNRVVFQRPVWIDLGGIAKGYAVDRAIEALQLPPTASGQVNAGGDLRVAGPEIQTVPLRVPGHPQSTHPLVELQEASLASSASAATRTAHVDGRDHQAVTPGRFVSVVAPSCMLADALTKVALAEGSPLERVLAACEATAYLYASDIGWKVLGGEKR
ncbi:MAG: FAD:protein FMN transferase [Gammaproteobacteria bacterium]|nr:FAD:protein FMN transferase [Gammaproteobacteria bacterium]